MRAVGTFVNSIRTCQCGDRCFSPAAYKNRAQTKTHFGNYDAAVLDYTEAIKLYQVFNQQPYVKAYYGRGVAKAKLGQYTEAIEDLTIMIEIQATGWCKALKHRALAQIHFGQYEAAVADFDNIISRNLGNINIHINRGIA